MSCEETSDDSAGSSFTLTKMMRTEEQSLNRTLHSSFMDCFEEVIEENSTAHKNTSAEKNADSTEIDLFLSISNISCHYNPYTWWQAKKFKFPCLIKMQQNICRRQEVVFIQSAFSLKLGWPTRKLLPKNEEKFVFLRYNLPLLNFDYENISNA
ncbi:hypothetical protein HHI36_003411 [Cryptolaemus montrouzieri]|uniref:Uncharacterized protein n=1 Tax=Cryptolaemus montrouzieri TaxID=559131 RepID=A0ABD2PDT2_9CUCU